MSGRTLFWICWINSLVYSAQSQKTLLSCPLFMENTLVTLSLAVDNSSFSSCSIGPTTVTCYFTPLNGTKSNICSQSVEQCDTVPTPDECVCTGATVTGYTYSLNFTARQNDHAGGDFSCSFDCTILPPPNLPTSPGTPPSVDITPSCLSITVVPPATTPPNTTTVAPTTTPPNTTSDSPGTASTESPSSNTTTSDLTTQHTGNNTTSSPSETTTETTGNVSSATTASSEPSSSPSPSTENGSTNKPTGNASSTTGPASDLALYAGLGFVGLVCLVGIVVAIVLIVRRRKHRKDLATNSGNHSSPDQRRENNYAYFNNTAL